MRTRSTVLIAPVLVMAAGCGGGSDAPEVITCETPGACSFEVVSGDDLTGPVGNQLTEPFVVRVVHASGERPPPPTVEWTAVSGASITPTDEVVDAMLQSSALPTLAEKAGPQVFRATLREDPSATVDFTVTAEPGPPQDLQVVSGDMQTGVAGAELPMPFLVRAVDAFGNPVAEQRIRWQVVRGTGEVESQASATDGNGELTAVATLGSEAGEASDRFIAEAVTFNGSAIFIATAVPAPPASLEVAGGDNQAGVRTEALAEPLVVRVADRFDNPVSGVEVTFEGVTEGAAVDPAIVATDDVGQAKTQATLGASAGIYTFRASASGLGPVDFSATAFPPLCSDDDWCWTAPVPQGNTLNDSFAASATDVWVVGDFGTILRWNGIAWEAFDSGTERDLLGVVGFGPDEAWAVGEDGTAIRFDGDQWRPQDIPTIEDLTDIWGSSADNMVAVGTSGTILTYDGTTWAPPPVPPTNERLNAVWGISATDVYVAGDNGVSLYFDGAMWVVRTAPMTDDLNGVWGDANDNVFFVGDNETYLRWNGAIFETFPSTNNFPMRAVFGVEGGEVFAVGARGRIRRYDSSTRTWRPEVSRTANELNTVTGSAGDLIAGGEGGVLIRRPANEWQLETSRRLSTLYRVWGTAVDALWAVGDLGTILSWDGAAWGEVDIGFNTSNIFGLHGSAADEVWAVGANGQSFHWTGGDGWRTENVRTPETLNAVHVFSSTIAWAVGDAGVIARWDGQDWRLDPVTAPNRLNGIWGARPNDIWAVGDFGLVMRYDGTSWAEVTSPTSASLIGIKGRSATDIYAFGTSGTLVRYDGDQWTTIVTGTTQILFSIHFAGGLDTWLVGDRGTLLRNQGSGWVPQQSGTRNILYGVFGVETDDVWIVGETGTILRRNPE